MPKPWAKRVGIGAVAVLASLQLVPYGRDHQNVPTVTEPAWSSPNVRALAERACFDCHSNHTRWPWYSHVAPVSWLVQRDVDEGRRALNFSEWNRLQRHAKKASKEVAEGEMPLAIYTVLHPDAVLSASDRQALVEGLKLSLATSPAGAPDDQPDVD